MKVSDVIAYFGSRKAAYEAIGIKRSAFSQWGETVPKSRQHKIQILTNGVIRADDDQHARTESAA